MEDLGSMLFPILIIAAICLVIGIVVGLMIASLRPSNQPGKEPSRRGLVEELRVWREERSKSLVVELDGQLYRERGGLSVGRYDRLIQSLTELSSWLGVAGSKPAPVSASTSIPTPAVPPVSSSATAPKVVPVQPVLTDAAAPGEEVKPVSMSVSDIVGRVLNPPKKEVVVPKSIAAQIDAILQDKLSLPENAALKERGIRLMELPGKGMVVLVGLNEYQGVGDVPDPEVRTLLKACVAEWEKRG